MADDPGLFTPRADKSFWIAVACGLALILGWAYWPTLDGICTAWLSNPDYTHGFFIVPVAIFILWLRRDHAPELALKIDWRGLALLALAGAIRCVAGRFYVLQLDAWSLPIWVAGVVWLLFGWPMLRWALPSIAFLWFATPLPGTIEIILSTPLQRMAASYAGSLLRLFGQPAIVEGTTILLDDKPLDVERACSGLRMFYGIFALAVGCIAVSRPDRWKAVLVLFAVAPVAILANVIRIAATAVLLKFASDESAQKFSHDLAGILMILLAVTLFMLFLLLLGHVVRRLSEPGGVAWLIKWCVAGVVLVAAMMVWGRHQEARALTTLLETATRFENEKDWPKTIQYMSRYVRAVPDDLDTFTHLARLYQTHATGYQDHLRGVDLMHTAWKNQPQHEDLALAAIQTAIGIQDFDDAIQICDELLAATTQPATRSQATKLRAEALLSYLQSDKIRGDYTWTNVKEAFEKELKLPDYEVAHAFTLATIYRNPATPMKNDQREKLANAVVERVMAERPNDPAAWLGRFRYRITFAKGADKSAAESDLAHAMELAQKKPKDPAALSVIVTAATYKLQHGESAEAISLLKQAIVIAPSDPTAYQLLADLKGSARTKESVEEAIAILRKGSEHIDKRDRLSLGLPLANYLAQSGKLQEAEATIAPLESSVPQLTGRLKSIVKLRVGLVRAQILLARDGSQPAQLYLHDLVDDPDIRLADQQVPDILAQCYAFLGQLYAATGLTDMALDSYRRAVRLHPAVTQWQIQLAALAQQTGDLDSADRDYRAYLQKNQSADDIKLRLVEVEMKRQMQQAAQDRNFDQAKRMLVAAQQQGASPVSVRLLAAEIMASSNDREKAEQTIVKLTEEFPKEPKAWRALALFRLQRADVPGALEAVEKFAATSDQSLEPTALKASILAGNGRADEAVKLLTGAVEKSSAVEMPKAAVALSQLLAQTGKAEEARAVLEKAHEKDPKSLLLVDTLANLALLAQDWKSLVKYESWLNTIEGNDGTLWRAYRAQRRLATAEATDSDDFRDAVAQVDTVVRIRPHWSKAYVLQGEIAYRMSQIDAAATSFERAWQLGGRGVLLIDRLIDVLTRQGRVTDARRYANQARDYLLFSQGLFDRAIPYLTQGNDSQDMARMAQKWVDDRPNDSEARLRLGRVLLMLSNSSTGDQKQKYIEQAKKEFRRAIELAPNDVRPWAATAMLYGESPATRDQALQTLDEFSKQPKINELERNFVLAQLYDSLGVPARAQLHYNRAALMVDANPKAEGASRVLGRIARFYSSRVPELAELYARRTLAHDPSNADAKLVLLLALDSHNDAPSAEEGLRMLDDSKTSDLLEPANAVRYRAGFLARRGRPDDTNAAIELMRRAVTQTREDKLLLARLYERAGQMPPALDLLQQLVRAPNANATEMIEFLRFWQQHFAAGAGDKTSIQFAGQAKETYQRLADLPGQLPESLRWRLRELQVRKPTAKLSTLECMPIVSEMFASPAAKSLNEKASKQLFQLTLIILLLEKHDDCALQLAKAPPAGISISDAAIMLCQAQVTVPATKELASERKQTVDTLLATHSKNADVVQAVGDCSFMASQYETAANAYQRVLQLKPDKRMARNNLALALVEANKIAEAREVLGVALKANANNADLLDTQATVDIIDHQAEQAIPVLEKLVAAAPDNPVFRFHLAIAYDDTKNTGAARESLFAATALGVQQQVLSPRDKKSLDNLKARYMAAESSAVADQSKNASQAQN